MFVGCAANKPQVPAEAPIVDSHSQSMIEIVVPGQIIIGAIDSNGQAAMEFQSRNKAELETVIREQAAELDKINIKP
jgi:putative methionine-R-sulfoxide reductase with GAF domain